MNLPALFFTLIEIRRMPGFPNGDLEVDDLCPGVNIIHGPNASGKSTLGQAIHRLLRPTDPPHGNESLRATFVLNDVPLSLDYDMGHVKCQKQVDGSDIDCPKLAPPEIGDHHLLALHQLVNTKTDHDLAQGIAKELAGGFDVAEASSDLGHRSRPASSRNSTRNLVSARLDYREVSDNQGALLKKQAELSQLQIEKKASSKAQARLGLLGRVKDYIDRGDEYEQARRNLEHFPEGVAKVTKQDVHKLDELQDLVATEYKERQSEQLKLESAQKSVHDCSLPEEGIAAELVTSMRLQCQRLSVLHVEIRNNKQSVKKDRAELAEVQQNIGPAKLVEETAKIDAGTLRELFKFVERAEKFRAEKNTADTLHDWLGADKPPEDVQSLHEGVHLLKRWLAIDQTGSGTTALSWVPLVIAVIGTIVLSTVMALRVHASWFLLLPTGLGLCAAWAFRQKRTVDRTVEIRRDYESLPLAKPPSWSNADVRTHVRELEHLHDKAALDQQKRMKWDGLAKQVEDLAQQEAALHTEKKDWTERFGIYADDEVTLYSLVSNIDQFQKVRQRLAGTMESVAAASEEFDTLLGKINDALSVYGFEASSDPDFISAQVEQLAQRQETHKAAKNEISGSTAALKRMDEHIQTWETELTGLFNQVELAPDQETTLRHLAEQRADYDEVFSEQQKAQTLRDSAGAVLADDPGLLGMSREELATEQQKVHEIAEQLTTISKDIGSIEQEIKTTQQGNDLEKALAHRMACRDVLRGQREEDYDAVVGNVFADYIDRQEHDSELPVILRRARELFARITHGRYELHVQLGDTPEFRARDTARGVGLTLDELSSGTRLQLLLAVRVAYVERQEQGVKVPLILDETLGNSDERRAQEIIEAALEICRDGRQVFYFTAQHDEVQKWRESLDACKDVQHRLVDLAEIRNFSEAERIPEIEYERTPRTMVPSPDEKDWLGYGRLLRVRRPALDGDLGDYHLWYLIDDLPTLYRLLNNGINKWGQLQTLVQYRHVDAITSDSEIFRRADATARLMESVSRNLKIGRGKQVDRKALLDSNAVSTKFIDRVSELAVQLAGDGVKLIESLNNGAVQGFRSDKRTALEEFLAARGYTDDRDVLTPEQIGNEVRVALFNDLEQGLITLERIDVLIALMTCGETSTPIDRTNRSHDSESEKS